MDGGGAAVHQERDPDRLGRLQPGCSRPGRGLAVRGDAPVAPLDHADGQRDQLLGLAVECSVGEGRLGELAEPAVDVGDGVAQVAVERGELAQHGLAVPGDVGGGLLGAHRGPFDPALGQSPGGDRFPTVARPGGRLSVGAFTIDAPPAPRIR